MKPPVGEVWASVLDVGQGLAIVVRTREHMLLFDAGGKSMHSDSAQTVILPFLRHQGWDRVDTLILSHNHADHTGGTKTIMSALSPLRILVGQTVKEVQGEFCRAGQYWEWDDVKFEILSPLQPAENLSTNDASCVLKVTAGRHSLLMPGDIERAGEDALVARYGDALAATAIIAPHHGSLTSSSVHFLRKVAPRYVVFSTGYRNRFGFPKPAVIARYQAQNATHYDTAQDGAIMLKFDAYHFMIPIAHRAQNTRWWH
jgi:competence protein ComEC